jgi:hypothetical protein
MDLDLAIWRISPGAEYRLSTDKQSILEWRGPGDEPTAQQLTAAWAAHVAEQAATSSTAQATATERTAATADFRDQHAAMTTALDAIIARNGTFTLAQAGQALDALAKGQKRLLRLLKAQLG